MGWRQPNTAPPPQHTEQLLWSEASFIHFCAIVFSGTCVMQKETERCAGALDRLQTEIMEKGQIRVKQNLQLNSEFVC